MSHSSSKVYTAYTFIHVRCISCSRSQSKHKDTQLFRLKLLRKLSHVANFKIFDDGTLSDWLTIDHLQNYVMFPSIHTIWLRLQSWIDAGSRAFEFLCLCLDWGRRRRYIINSYCIYTYLNDSQSYSILFTHPLTMPRAEPGNRGPCALLCWPCDQVSSCPHHPLRQIISNI